MRLGRDDAGDSKLRQRLCLVLHILDLEADHDQLFHDRIEGFVGIEMITEPREGELHRKSPRPAPLPRLRGRVRASESPSAKAIVSSTSDLFVTTSGVLKGRTRQ